MVVLWQRKCSPNNAFSTSLRESLLIKLLVLVHSTIGKNHALVLQSVSASPTCYWIGILLYSCPWTISGSRCILIVVYKVSSACQYCCLRSMPLGCMLFPLVFGCLYTRSLKHSLCPRSCRPAHPPQVYQAHLEYNLVLIQHRNETR